MTRGYLKITNNAVEIKKYIDLLNGHGVDVENIIISDNFSEVIDAAKANDSVIVYSLSNVFNSMSDMFDTVQELENKGVVLVSIQESWFDTKSNKHNMVDIMAKLADLNRTILSARTKTGLKKAVSSGKQLGRPFGTTKQPSEVMSRAIKLYLESGMTVTEICKTNGLKPRMFYKHLNSRGIKTRRK